MTTSALLALLVATALQSLPAPPVARTFTLDAAAEVVATITAGCAACDWGVAGREAVLLELVLDGAYSQHVPLVRGRTPSPYRVMLGPLGRGMHGLTVRQDRARSSPEAGDGTIGRIDIETVAPGSPDYDRLANAPFLRARPDTVERFSDLPLLQYVEENVQGEGPGPYRLQYTVIFSHEDGGTATDRLMATWGRTTDIEFVYGVTGASGSGLIQAEGHTWVPFAGPRVGAHPELWVATDNNMVADRGASDAIRFAPAPALVSLGGVSREAVMDGEPWTYAVTAAEMRREGRVDPAASPRSGRIPDPRRYAVVEACADVTDATLAFDIGVRGADGGIAWAATDRGEPAFRIARGGCFRGGAPLPDGSRPADIVALRVRAYTRPPREGEQPLPPGRGHVLLHRINRVFMLDDTLTPVSSPLRWTGALVVPSDAAPVAVPFD